MIESILKLTEKYFGNWDKVYEAIVNKEKPVEPLSTQMTNSEYIFITDKNYPTKFKDILMPPFFMFYQGDIDYINQTVLLIDGHISTQDLKKIITHPKSNDYVYCFNNDDLTIELFNLLVKHNQKIIVICEGGFDYFKYNNNYKHLLLVSEFNNSNTFKKAPGQTVERIMFAVADKIFLNATNERKLRNLLINLEQKKKPIYCQENYKYNNQMMIENNINIEQLKCIYEII